MDEEPLPRLPASLDDRFQVTEVLGHGNYGCVYGVRPRGGGATRALKIISVEGDPRRALREIEAARRVIHPHLLRCHEAGLLGGSAYLLLERAEGTLADFLRRRSALGSVWRWILQAARGTGALHAAGLVHRDLKPSNVLITDEGAKLGDLGLARGGSLERLTSQGMILGTPAYMAPEQARGEPVDAKADVFSLAVLFYEAIEGRLPYPDAHPMQLVVEVGQGNVRDFHRARRILTPDILDLLEQALLPDPRDRPESLIGLVDFPPDRLPSDDISVASLRDPGSDETMLKPLSNSAEHATWVRQRQERSEEESTAEFPIPRDDPAWMGLVVQVLQFVVFLLLAAVVYRYAGR